MNKEIYSPSDITIILEKIINSSTNGITYKIKGELGNYSKRGGHIYANIKDKESSIDIISWNNTNDYQNGDEIIITGKFNYYRKTNKLSIVAHSIEKKGLGDLFKKYLQFKDHYETLGYFDKSSKKNQPQCINNLAIITSSDGAAIRDILYVLKDNGFKGNIYLKDCMVQGISAGKSVGDSIKLINEKYKNIDAILVTRGGGSFEDLFQFSSTEVIESLHSSNIYTISAVGHETDNMLSDYVADYRAPTPSIGAQYISNIYLNKFNILKKGNEKVNIIKELINRKKDKITSSINRIKTFNIFDKIQQEIKNKKLLLKNTIKYRQYEIKNKLKYLRDKIIFLEEKEQLLFNGYSMLIDPETEKTINDVEDIGYDFILVIKNKKYLIKPATILEIIP
jgi:exodeoxyribonuclease VII large subunit